METTDPKERIINAAQEIFGDKGFKSTTIRDICKKADVSLALVNYHFRNKQLLYEHIIINAVERAFSANPASAFISDDMSPEDKLKNFIRLLIHRLFGASGLGSSQAAVKIIAMELTNPTEVMEKIYSVYLSRMIAMMSSIINELMGEMDNKESVRFASSIAGQCMHPLIARGILARSGFVLENNIEAIEQHAEHIYRFSLYGIKGYKGGNQ